VTRQGTASASVLELHKVSVPERRTTAKALRQRLAEVFFPDDPLHQFKNQSSARRLVLALQYFFPIFQWGSAYNPRLLRSDLIAGLTIASLAIPQARALLSPASPPPPSPSFISSLLLARFFMAQPRMNIGRPACGA
jgi:sulfate transporter 3